MRTFVNATGDSDVGMFVNNTRSHVLSRSIDYCCSGSWKVLTYRFDLTIGEQHVSIFQDACFFIGPHSCVFDQGGLCLWQGLIAIGDKRIDHISINGQVRSEEHTSELQSRENL